MTYDTAAVKALNNNVCATAAVPGHVMLVLTIGSTNNEYSSSTAVPDTRIHTYIHTYRSADTPKEGGTFTLTEARAITLLLLYMNNYYLYCCCNLFYHASTLRTSIYSSR